MVGRKNSSWFAKLNREICLSVCEKWFPEIHRWQLSVWQREPARGPRCTVSNQRVEFRLAFNKSIRIAVKEVREHFWTIALEGFCLFMSELVWFSNCLRLVLLVDLARETAHTDRCCIVEDVDGISKSREEIRDKLLTLRYRKRSSQPYIWQFCSRHLSHPC